MATFHQPKARQGSQVYPSLPSLSPLSMALDVDPMRTLPYNPSAGMRPRRLSSTSSYRGK